MEQHSEDIGTRKDLCLYRIQTAKDNLKAAKILFDAKEYDLHHKYNSQNKKSMKLLMEIDGMLKETEKFIL